MMLDSRDLTILRLAGIYGWLPAGSLKNFGNFAGMSHSLKNLSASGLISVARNGIYYNPSPQGYELLKKHGYPYGPPAKRAYLKSTALTRRFEAAEIAMTCLRAGINALCDAMEDLRNPPAFLPSLALRRQGGGNLMNAATCAGFAHFGDGGYIFQYVSDSAEGMYLSNELRHLHNLTAAFSSDGPNAPVAVIFAGESYKKIYGACLKKEPSARHEKKAFKDFWHVYGSLSLPIHFVTCDDTGATQLAAMRVPGYKSKIAEAAFGGRWRPVDGSMREADGHVGGSPLVVALDMDLRRVIRICAEAEKSGRGEVMVAALGSQMDGLLLETLAPYGQATPLIINEHVLLDAFGEKFSLGGFPKNPAVGIKGGYIFV